PCKTLATPSSPLLPSSPPLPRTSSSSSSSALSTPPDSEYGSPRLPTPVPDERPRALNEQVYNHHFLENFGRPLNGPKDKTCTLEEFLKLVDINAREPREELCNHFM
ncbi:MAG: hypothetical protein Q9225_006664, partial [Loekoesia sp. 1 TL-2023]